MFKIFIAGGPVFMAILTVILVAMFFAAWKAPRWVKEIGACALAFGIFSSMLGVIQMKHRSIVRRIQGYADSDSIRNDHLHDFTDYPYLGKAENMKKRRRTRKSPPSIIP